MIVNLKSTHTISEDLLRLSREASTELTSLLHFWSTEALDLKNGGFLGEIDGLGNKNNFATKGAVLNSRILWTFSAAYRITKNEKYKEMADLQYQYIINHFWDQKHGGLIWEVDHLGNAINKRKQAYAQGFGIYAFSEYYKATDTEESLDYAKTLYHILESKFYDTKYSGYIEALQEDWSRINDMRLSDKDLNYPKSMNTHLHILEPYANLYRVWKDKSLKNNIIELLSIFQNKIIDKKTGHFNLFFGMDWTNKSAAISFGHDIEGAWLLHEAAQVIEDKTIIEKVQETAVKLVDLTVEKGLDKDGSLFNELDGNVYDTDKHWWVQAEAIVGLMDAYVINPKQEYLDGMLKIWDFIKNHLIDRKNGEWFWRVDTNGQPIARDYKLGFWKCPYHNSRALMEIIERIALIKNETL
ncbi:AGE family epimerase/isomerase [uncultured Polaribacter sp.]|uniref:AGE family epimerase/isomerase n=1 Tax=uncultured Polaribacter sp. TaxID=174711 RepID=UPI00262A19B3|nr:AGE family epimerase/isomerase [uncultured Polaribacter sp.]